MSLWSSAASRAPALAQLTRLSSDSRLLACTPHPLAHVEDWEFGSLGTEGNTATRSGPEPARNATLRERRRLGPRGAVLPSVPRLPNSQSSTLNCADTASCSPGQGHRGSVVRHRSHRRPPAHMPPNCSCVRCAPQPLPPTCSCIQCAVPPVPPIINSCLRCAPQPSLSPIARHLPAFALCVNVLFGIDFGATPSWLPMWKYITPIVTIALLAQELVLLDTVTYIVLYVYVFCVWLFAPAWLLPLRYLQPLLREIFEPRSESEQLLRNHRAVLLWGVEIGLGLFAPLFACAILILTITQVTLLRIGQSPPPSFFFWTIAIEGIGFALYIPLACVCLGCVNLITILHLAQLELLKNHWKRRTRHPFLEAQPPFGEAWTGQWLCLRCPSTRMGAQALVCCAKGARGLALRSYCYADERWKVEHGLETVTLRDLGESTAICCASAVDDFLPGIAVSKEEGSGVPALPAFFDEMESFDAYSSRLTGRAPPLLGATVIEPSLDLVIESFNVTRRSLEITSSTTGVLVAVMCSISLAIMISLLLPGIQGTYAHRPSGNNWLLTSLIYWIVSAACIYPFVTIDRKWRQVEILLAQNVVMYNGEEQLRLMAVLARSSLSMTLCFVPATTSTGSVFMLVMSGLLGLILYFFSLTIGSCQPGVGTSC